MNVLVLTENYLNGGLETNIAIYNEELKNENNLFYCVCRYKDYGILKSENIYSDFHFSFDVTIGQICEDVERLVKIIVDNNIDVIQVHPFYAIYSAWFAANITNTKLVYTYHGNSSLNYCLNLFDEILTEYIFEKSVSTALCVTKLGEYAFKTINFFDTQFLPNPIDTNLYRKSKVINNGKWALISRLDIDKVSAIERLFEILPQLNIDEIDVYGDGTETERLKNITSKLGKKINFLGFHNDLNEVLLDKYNGVIGLGRCAIEGLSMGYPVLFIGYGKVCGIIDRDIYDMAKNYNFVAGEFQEISVQKINAQIEEISKTDKYYLRDEICKDFDIKNISKKYLEILKTAKPIIPQSNIIEMYNKLKDISQSSDNLFHNCNETFNIAKEYIMPYTRNMYIRSKFLIKDEIDNKVQEKVNNALCNREKYYEDQIKTLLEKIQILENQNKTGIDYLSNNLNTRWILRNDIKKIKNKINKNK